MDEKLKEITENLNKIELSPMNVQNQDARLVAIKEQEKGYKVSGGAFLGNQGIELPNGEYVNQDEVLKAVQDAISNQQKEKITVKSKNSQVEEKLIDPSKYKDFVKQVKSASKVVLRDLDKIKNQDARMVSVSEKNSKLEKDSGAVFLGNKEIELPNGEYVSEEEIKLALIDLVKPLQKDKPEEKTIVPTLPRRMKVKRRLGLTIPTILIIIAMLLSKTGNALAPGEMQETISPQAFITSESVIDYEQTTPVVNYEYEEAVQELADEEIEIEVQSPILGDIVFLEEGTQYNIASDRSDVKGTTGRTIRQEGLYTVNAFSFLDENGNIIKAVYEPGTRMEDVRAELEAQGKIIGDVQLHHSEGMNLDVRDKAAGWIRYDENSYEAVDNIAPVVEIDNQIVL